MAWRVRAKLITIIGGLAFFSGCTSNQSYISDFDNLKNMIKESTYIALSTSAEEYAPDVTIKLFDEQGELSFEGVLKDYHAQNSSFYNGYIYIYGGDKALLVDTLNRSTYVIDTDSDASISDAFVDVNRAYFILNYGYNKDKKQFESGVCYVDLETEQNFTEDNFNCVNLKNSVIDLYVDDESIVASFSDFGTLQEYLIFFDKNLSALEQTNIPSKSSYILGKNHEDYIVYNLNDYYLTENKLTLPTPYIPDLFSFVHNFGNYYIRMNYYSDNQQIIKECIVDGELSSDILIDTQALGVNKIYVVSPSDNNYVPIEISQDNGTFGTLYDVKNKVFDEFYYELSDNEKLIGLYKLN